MRFILLALVGMMCSKVVSAVEIGVPSDKSNEAWVASFQRFARQENRDVESSYTPRTGDGAQLVFSDLLRTLPAPPEWPRLRDTLREAVSRSSGAKKENQLQLKAGLWLMDYLTGDRTKIDLELADAMEVAKTEKYGGRAFALQRLRDSLKGQNESEDTAEKKVREFEAHLAALEPVDEAAVKLALGGEENFARLKRLMVAARELQDRFGELAKEYEINKDEAAARAKAEALQKEYVEKYETEWTSLLASADNSTIARYMQSVAREESGESPGGYVDTLYVPDLVGVLGRERASELLRRAFLVRAKLAVDDKSTLPTQQLVRELILAEIGQIQVASWGLVRNAHSAELFEAFRKKFPQADLKDYEYQQACGYYLAGLVVQGRPKDAVKFVTEFGRAGDAENQVRLPYELMEEIEQNHAEKLWEFLHGWLTVDPGISEWERFNRLSVQLDRRAELKNLIKTLAADGSFNGMNRLKVQRMQADSEMATGEITAAVERLRILIQTPAATEDERREQMNIVLRLLKLADLQGDQTGFSSLLAAAETILEKDRADSLERGVSKANDLIEVLNELGRFPESERLGRSELDRIPELEKNAVAKKQSEDERVELPDHIFNDLLGEELRAHVELGHWPEARALLQENTWWGAKNVEGLLNRHVSSSGKPVGYYVARVEQARGDPALARRILEAQLAVTPAVDAVYEAYLGLVGQGALPLLEKLTVSDRYEERPLIWKARLQMDQKQWDVAAATLQQAITIDPSDGEQGRGDRMRVYALMSLVMAAKGDVDKAGFFANVVKAIRLSETADRWYAIGAYTKAIELYREALGFFQDAYCIQSRLAIRLADAGKMDEAAEHYRHAFELMPDSFGRVESHCFGCEHVFAGKKSQGLAEEVFARMLKARPDKPQLHYLSGYLREEQDRLSEAAEHYRRAVELDPFYLNAWKHLQGLDLKLKFSATQRDDLLLKLIELDPGQKHVSPDLKDVSDLPRLWRVMKETGEVLDALPVSGDLGELPASAARFGQAKETVHRWDSIRRRQDFASVLLDHNFVGALQGYLISLNQPSEESGEPTTQEKPN